MNASAEVQVVHGMRECPVCGLDELTHHCEKQACGWFLCTQCGSYGTAKRVWNTPKKQVMLL